MVDEFYPDSVVTGGVEHVTFCAGFGACEQGKLMASLDQAATGEQDVLLCTAYDEPGYDLHYFHSKDFTTEAGLAKVSLPGVFSLARLSPPG